MPKYLTTEKTPKFWRGQPTPPVGTPVEMTKEAAKYEVSLGILVPADDEQKGKAKSSKKVADPENKETLK